MNKLKKEINQISVNPGKKEITRKQAIKRIGFAGVATTSMLMLLQTKKASGSSVYPDNPGSSDGF